MAAATADRLSEIRDAESIIEETHAIATAQTIYVGTLVNFVTTTGRICSATAATSRRFAGEVVEIINDSSTAITAGTGNTGGTVKARIRYGHQMLLNVRTAARTFTSLTKNVFVSDDNSVTDTTGAGTAGVRVKVGTLVQFEASDKSTAWVALRRFADADAA